MQAAEVIQRAIDYVEEHLFEDVSLERIGEAAAMSVPNLYRMFYAVTGHPVKEYIRKRRTSEAACRLRETDFPANEIGYTCGFDTYRAFINTFKRYTGLTPGVYRRSAFIFSFERIRLNECVAYLEDREISERFQDVKVIRIDTKQGIGYLYASNREEGLEELALERFRSLLDARDVDYGQVNLFGWNVDMEGGPEPFGYQMAAIAEPEVETLLPDTELGPVQVPGGLYAVTRTPGGDGTSIVAAWNRILSEWLPRSTFELGDHGYLEEYLPYRNRIAGMKLYLPVRREKSVKRLAVVDRPAVKVMRFRAEGKDARERADQASIAWLGRSGLQENALLDVFMTCAQGIAPEDEGFYHEVCIAVPEAYRSDREDEHLLAQLDGGTYAFLTTGAYGSMTGELERMYRWLENSSEYEADPKRGWYARYILPEVVNIHNFSSELEQSVTVECYLAVRAKTREEPL